MNAGEGVIIYQKYVPFTLDGVTKHLVLYIFNGLAPPPQADMKF